MDKDKMELVETLITISVVSKMLAAIVMKGEDEEDEGKDKCHHCPVKGMCDKAH